MFVGKRGTAHLSAAGDELQTALVTMVKCIYQEGVTATDSGQDRRLGARSLLGEGRGIWASDELIHVGHFSSR